MTEREIASKWWSNLENSLKQTYLVKFSTMTDIEDLYFLLTFNLN